MKLFNVRSYAGEKPYENTPCGRNWKYVTRNKIKNDEKVDSLRSREGSPVDWKSMLGTIAID